MIQILIIAILWYNYDRGELRTPCVVQDILGLPVVYLRLSKGANLGLLESYVATWK